MNRRGLTVDQQKFIETFLAIAYFRVPEFRSKIMECLPDEEDVQIDEWKPTHFSLDATEATGVTMPALFNWDREFYNVIPEVFFIYKQSSEKQQALAFLKTTLDLKEWKARIKKRGLAFFSFVRNWASYVYRVTSKDTTPWQDIPGYATLVKGILYELKLRNIVNYPDALKGACCTLLANENMLTVFVDILFKRTAVYDYKMVNASLDFVIMLFTSLHGNYNKPMPSNFDYQFFFKGIDILLEMDDLLSCEKCLSMIYKIAHLLPSIPQYHPRQGTRDSFIQKDNWTKFL